MENQTTTGGNHAEIVIYDYYEKLPSEEKKKFRMEVAQLIYVDTSGLYRRLRLNRWSPLERTAVLNYIKERCHE